MLSRLLQTCSGPCDWRLVVTCRLTQELQLRLFPRVNQKKKTSSFSSESCWALAEQNRTFILFFFFPERKRNGNVWTAWLRFCSPHKIRLRKMGRVHTSGMPNILRAGGRTGLTVGLWVDAVVVLLVSWFFSADLRRLAVAAAEQLHHFRIGEHLSRLRSASGIPRPLWVCLCETEPGVSSPPSSSSPPPPPQGLQHRRASHRGLPVSLQHWQVSGLPGNGRCHCKGTVVLNP